jgi:hypothetical protein
MATKLIEKIHRRRPLKETEDPDSLMNAMKERFPSLDFLLALERGAKANVKH